MKSASVVLLLLMIQGCALTFDARSLGVPTSMSEPAGQVVQGVEFDVNRTAVFFFWGAVGAGRPSLQKALAGQLVDGSAVANLRIRVRSRFVDLLVTAITAGIIVPRTVSFRGTVVNRSP